MTVQFELLVSLADKRVTTLRRGDPLTGGNGKSPSVCGSWCSSAQLARIRLEIEPYSKCNSPVLARFFYTRVAGSWVNQHFVFSE